MSDEKGRDAVLIASRDYELDKIWRGLESKLIDDIPVGWMLAGVVLICFVGIVGLAMLFGNYSWELFALFTGCCLLFYWLHSVLSYALWNAIGRTLSEHMLEMVQRVSFWGQTRLLATDLEWTDELRTQRVRIDVFQDNLTLRVGLLASSIQLGWFDVSLKGAKRRVAEFLVSGEMSRFRQDLKQHDNQVKTLIAELMPQTQQAAVAK